MARCRGRKADGEPCGAPESLVDEATGFCPSHAPGASARLSEAGRKGAEATARKLRRGGLDPDELPPLDGPQTAALWLDRVGRATATQRLGHREARAVIAAVEAFLKAHEAGELEAQVTELRDALDDWRRTGDPKRVLEVVE